MKRSKPLNPTLSDTALDIDSLLAVVEEYLQQPDTDDAYNQGTLYRQDKPQSQCKRAIR